MSKKFVFAENNQFKILDKLNFKQEIKPIYYTVTELLGSKKFFDDKHLYVFEKLIKYEVVEEDLFSNYEEQNIYEYNEYCANYMVFL